MIVEAVKDLWAKNLICNNHLDINIVYWDAFDSRNKAKSSNNYAGRTSRRNKEPMDEIYIGDKCVSRSFFTLSR